MPRLKSRGIRAFLMWFFIYLPGQRQAAVSPTPIVTASVVATITLVTLVVALNECVTEDLFVLASVPIARVITVASVPEIMRSLRVVALTALSVCGASR